MPLKGKPSCPNPLFLLRRLQESNYRLLTPSRCCESQLLCYYNPGVIVGDHKGFLLGVHIPPPSYHPASRGTEAVSDEDVLSRLNNWRQNLCIVRISGPSSTLYLGE